MHLLINHYIWLKAINAISLVCFNEIYAIQFYSSTMTHALKNSANVL